jgi:branched-chain amino acid aminotransferase
VRDGVLATPPGTDGILEGITRDTLLRLAREELSLQVVERSIDRTELYIAEEIFLCGTGAQLSPVTSVDHRTVGDGSVGKITQRLSKVYFDAVRGVGDRYREWLTPIYPA